MRLLTQPNNGRKNISPCSFHGHLESGAGAWWNVDLGVDVGNSALTNLVPFSKSD